MAGRQIDKRLETGQFSHPGRRRANNEDWLGTFRPEDAERLLRKGSLFLVADGMGGHQAGEIASRRAVDFIIRTYMDDAAPDVADSLGRAIQAANAQLHAQVADRQGSRRWGTTLVGAVVRQDELWIANVGDSRAYLLRGGKLRQLSQDHSLAAAGPGEEPAGEWIGKHIITRALGLKPVVEVDLFPPLKLRPGDRVLLCSDGLTTPLSDAEIQEIAARQPVQRAAEALVNKANEKGGPDNVSVILIQVGGGGPAFDWLSLQDDPAALFRPGTWQLMVSGLGQALAAGEFDFRSPLFIIAVLLLVLLVIGVGFALGLLIF